MGEHRLTVAYQQEELWWHKDHKVFDPILANHTEEQSVFPREKWRWTI